MRFDNAQTFARSQARCPRVRGIFNGLFPPTLRKTSRQQHFRGCTTDVVQSLPEQALTENVGEIRGMLRSAHNAGLYDTHACYLSTFTKPVAEDRLIHNLEQSLERGLGSKCFRQ